VARCQAPLDPLPGQLTNLRRRLRVNATPHGTKEERRVWQQPSGHAPKLPVTHGPHAYAISSTTPDPNCPAPDLLAALSLFK
jgi:hypothetical protein